MEQFLRYLELRRDEVEDWSVYPFSIPAVENLERLDFHPAVTFFVGENGSGKSTLIEAIAIKAGFGPEGGTKGFSTSLRPSESELHQVLRLVRGARRERSSFFLRAETMFNISTAAEAFTEYGWESLHEMSHGEGFLWVMNNRFRNRGLYVLDEPEAALSPQRQLACLARIHQLVLGGSQFIISTHSPILMAYPRARIYELGSSGIDVVRYRDTEHYAVTHAFLHDPDRMLRTICEGVEPSDD